MMRFRLTTRPVALFGAIFVLALIVLMPLRLVLGWFDLDHTRLSAREATGSVWFGAVREAQLGGIALGDLDAALSPWALLVGHARIGLASDSPVAPGALRGAVSVSRHTTGIDDMTARVATGSVFAPLPVSALDLDDVSAHFVDGKCDTAEGRVKATVNGDIGGTSLGQGLSGAVRCDAGALLLPLISQAGTERVALRLWQTGRYSADLIVKPTDAAAAQKLALSGFRPTTRGYLLTVDGRF